MQTLLSNSLIGQRRTETLEAQLLRKVVSLRDITLIDNENIEYQGTRIKITKSAFKNLISLIGMPAGFVNKFEMLFSKEAKSQFINTIKNAMSNTSILSEVTIMLNPATKTITAINKKDDVGISNQQFLNVAEGIIDKHNMGVSNWSICPNSGIVTINAFNPDSQFSVNGLSDEIFSGGVTLMNSPREGFQVMPYVNRLFCENGMTTAMSQDSYQLNSLDATSMETFFRNIEESSKRNFVPEGFIDRVKIAHSTPASLHEMQYAHNLIYKFAGERSDNWINLNENMNAYHNAGFESLNSDQMKDAKSNTSVWDVIQGATHFATHGQNDMETKMTDSDSTSLMLKSGRLFSKNIFDHETSMPNVWAGRELVRSGSLLN